MSLTKIAAPTWAAIYLVVFRGFAAPIFVSTTLLWGVWYATLFLSLLYAVWGVIFYLILLQTDSFENFKVTVEKFLEKRKGKVFEWLRKNFFEGKSHLEVSPIICMAMIVAESPLTGVPLIRFAYPKEKMWQGLMWVVIGSLIEVVTWYLPIYGGGFAAIQAIWIATGIG